MKIAVVGLGYVGFPLACAVARNSSYEVAGFDLDKEKIVQIKRKESPVQDARARKDIKVVKLPVADDPAIMEGAELFLVCVPTPLGAESKPDLTPLKKAVGMVAGYLQKGGTVVIESTVNPGVCDEVVIPMLEETTGLKVGQDFDVAHCPERINPGDPEWNIYNIPRNVGASSPEACKKVAKFYRSIIQAEVNEVSSLKVAEATKIIENTFRDINIAYVNELAKSFDVLGVDLIEVLKAASNKPFAFMPHFPGCGVGGHCIPVDPYYLIQRASESGFDHSFLTKAREVNESMPQYTVDLLMKSLTKAGLTPNQVKVGVMGVSYKANIADKRESPALKIIRILREDGLSPEIFDPYHPEDSTVRTLDELLDAVEVIIIATDHQDFRQMRIEDFEARGIKVLIDGKNMLNPLKSKGSKIIYKGIGRG
jgi:nucleotide sugar dehydrogenase